MTNSELLKAFARASTQSVYRRFFGIKRDFTAEETAFFLNVDFIKHVALLAVPVESTGPAIAGGGRYVVVEPGRAELAFMVTDEYQGKGIGTVLLHHLSLIARASGISDLFAQVLPENVPMLQVFHKFGTCVEMKHERGVVNVALHFD